MRILQFTEAMIKLIKLYSQIFSERPSKLRDSYHELRRMNVIFY